MSLAQSLSGALSCEGVLHAACVWGFGLKLKYNQKMLIPSTCEKKKARIFVRTTCTSNTVTYGTTVQVQRCTYSVQRNGIFRFNLLQVL